MNQQPPDHGAAYCGGSSCATEIAFAVQVLSGRWAVPVLEGLYFAGGSSRFRALQRRIGLISHKELARQLNKLVEHHVVVRSAARAPLEVTYSLTESGLQLMRRMQALGDWSRSRTPDPAQASWLGPLVSASRTRRPALLPRS